MIALRKTFTVIIWFGWVFFLYMVIDLTVGGWLLDTLKPYAVRLNHPSYLNEPYYSQVFLKESYRQPEGWQQPYLTRIILPNEYHGQYFNVDRLSPTQLTYRRTVNPDFSSVPKQEILQVLVLGGSTVYCSEVPDEKTLPSLISQALNASGAGHFEVRNAGVAAGYSAEEIERLRYELKHGLKPDIIINYHGVNEIVRRIYRRNPFRKVNTKLPAEGQATKRKKKEKRFWPPNRILTYFEEKAKLQNKRVIPEHLEDEETLSLLAVQTALNFTADVIRMDQLAKAYGARYFDFLQPHLFSEFENPYAADLERSKKHADFYYPLIGKAFQHGYPVLRNSESLLAQKGIPAYDLSELFNSKQENIYLDFCHVNSAGNEEIAEAIAEKVLASLEKND